MHSERLFRARICGIGRQGQGQNKEEEEGGDQNNQGVGGRT